VTVADLSELLDAYAEAIRTECDPALDDMGRAYAIRASNATRKVLDYEVGRLCATRTTPLRCRCPEPAAYPPEGAAFGRWYCAKCGGYVPVHECTCTHPCNDCPPSPLRASSHAPRPTGAA
jgi:hypothetical protein